MPKEIKKHYNFMNLSFSSTIEDVEMRQKSMIKIVRAKAIKKGKSYNDKINKIALSAHILVEFINKNGIPKINDNLFETDKRDMVYQVVVLGIVLAISICSIIALI